MNKAHNSIENNKMHPKQGGFSVVELIIAFALGIVVVTGVVQLFVNNKQTYDLLNAQSRIQENARFALDFITREARMSSHIGCLPYQFGVRNSTGLANLPFEADLTRGLEGFEGAPGGAFTPVLTRLDQFVAGGTPINTAQIQADTDVLVSRRIDTDNGYRLAVPMINNSVNITIAVPAGATLPFNIGDYALISDCEKAAIFEITGTAPGGGAGQTVLQRDTTIPIVVGNLPFDSDATVYPIQTTAFYIAPGTAVGAPLSLWGKMDDNPPAELVPGVEDLQVSFGRDADGDGVPNQYFGAAALSGGVDVQLQQVVTLLVTMTVNSVDTVGIDGNAGDGRIRRTFNQNITIRNRN